MDGKPATATHFSLNPTKSSNAKAIAPIAVDPNTQWTKPAPVVQATTPGGQKAVVTYVDDGDSARLRTKDGSNINCRIDSIDAPEVAKPKLNKPGQPFGEEAKKTLQGMIDRKEVTVIVTKPADSSSPPSKENNYGRSLCKIEVQGQGVDAKMLSAGAAWLYRKYGESPDPKLQAIESKARVNQVGLWADPTAEDPKSFRRRTN